MQYLKGTPKSKHEGLRLCVSIQTDKNATWCNNNTIMISYSETIKALRLSSNSSKWPFALNDL